MSVAEDLRRRAADWIAADPDPATRAELGALLEAGDEAALHERFDRPLRFGTAGLRARLGAGPARMNRAVVRRTTAGLCRVIAARGPGAATRGLVVGHDARHGSAAFAADVAEVAAALSVRVRLLATALPTPLCAFALRHFGAEAAVVVTASHNPAQDNGYKVYAADGAQVIPPEDEAISRAAEAAAPPPAGPVCGVEVVDEQALIRAYTDRCLALVQPGGPRDLSVVYTPLHGVGGAVFPGLLAAAGFPAPAVVAAQATPDPDFPTVAFPNPEEPGALDLALALGEARGADIVLANDPDADRLALAVRDGRTGGLVVLSGDQLGVLLAEHVLARTSGPDRLVATTIVSSSLLGALAAEAGVAYVETLTGFKWIVRAAQRRPGHRLVFGYEEALGFCIGDAVADKDGLSAALVAAEMAAEAKAAGASLLDRLDALEARLGVHLTSQLSLRREVGRAADEMAGILDAWRVAPPSALGGDAVTEVRDLRAGGSELPPTDALVLRLGENGRVTLRPSGTEAKVKFYFEATTPPPGPGGLLAARSAARTRLRSWEAAVAARSAS